MVEQGAELAHAARFAGRGLVRIDPERCVDALVLRRLERAPTGVDPGSDRDDARDAGGAGTVERPLRRLERVEVRVGVDHAARRGGHVVDPREERLRRPDPGDRFGAAVRDVVPGDVDGHPEGFEDPLRGLGQVRRERDGG